MARTGRPKTQPAICTHPDGCDKPAKARGLCSTHHNQWRKQEAIRNGTSCSVLECEAPLYVQGLCLRHYQSTYRKFKD